VGEATYSDLILGDISRQVGDDDLGAIGHKRYSSGSGSFSSTSLSSGDVARVLISDGSYATVGSDWNDCNCRSCVEASSACSSTPNGAASLASTSPTARALTALSALLVDDLFKRSVDIHFCGF
jgi:hypothetical protein